MVIYSRLLIQDVQKVMPSLDEDDILLMQFWFCKSNFGALPCEPEKLKLPLYLAEIFHSDRSEMFINYIENTYIVLPYITNI